MRENASRFFGLTCRLKATRLLVSMCCVLLAAATAATAATDFSDYSVFTSASSTTVSSIKIGATTDSETAITANATATGDDTTGSDDEDGVTVPASIMTGTTGSLTVNVTNTSGSTVYLNAWIDYNRNGVLTDSGEQIATNTLIVTGTSNSNRTVSFTVPATASMGTAGLRVRLTSTSTPGPTGLKGNGEVEDYVTTISCPSITLSTSSLSDGAVSWPYSQTLGASGGNGSYTWALTSGTLPAGLSFNSSTGVISGTPTVSTESGASLTFTATDANGCQGSATLLLQVFNFITITPTTLPPPTVSTAYSQTMTGLESGFDVQQAFSSTSVGTLAAADAVLAGTNRISNWTGTASTIAYNGSSAGGGHVTDTGFPGGSGDNFALKATGIITIPTAGEWTFLTNSDDGARVKIDGSAVINDDTLHATSDRLGTVTLTAGIHVIELVFFEQGGGEAIELFAAPGTQTSFNSSFKLIGADDGLSVARTSPTFTWSVASGSLPTGLTLNASTGVISGTPTSSSTFNFTLRATDNLGYYGTQAYTVKPCSAITLSPSSLAASMVNSAYSQTFSATGGTQPYGFALISGTLPAGLTLNSSTGVISGTPTSTTAASFTVSATDANGCQATRSYTLTPAATDFGDYASFGSVSSNYNANLKLGALFDTESAATTDATATGDDLSGADDEDGVTLPAFIVQGTSGSMTVNTTNTTGATAYLNAWIDYNNTGVLTDSGEQIAANTLIATGTSNSNRTLSFTVPGGASAGSVGVRVRLTSTSSPGSTGASGNGEVEDYVVNILPPSDFGDDSSFGIAGSTTSTSVRMGALVDSESSGLANAAATGDDTNGSDDEDGVTLPATVIQGQSGVSVTVNLTNTSGADAFLNGWIDFNNNGLLTDAGEQIIINDVVTTGTSGSSRSYSFTVPSAAATGAIGARFRLSSIATPGDTGMSGTGEVEDYNITVQSPSDHGDFSRFADASSYNSSALGIGDLEDTEITAVTNLAATGDDITNFNDEDGVTLQAILVQGQAGVAVTVKLNNTTGAPAYLNGWVDFNNNGVVTDAGEQVISDVVVDDGTSGD
ncbi:MAG: GEVED domain-containing protein, partial [Prosthecobacter sp.]|uniref:beta strand repeat-containing protein n=1 Tax=Prosthecobacter sp. TaxID=1965333 RepID=UPI003BAE2DA3